MAMSSARLSEPIFSFMHLKPCISFSSMRLFISLNVPIHTSPLVGMPSSPRLNGVSNISGTAGAAAPLGCMTRFFSLLKCSKAVSKPKSIEG